MSDVTKTLGPWDGTGPLPAGMGQARTAPVEHLEDLPVAPTPDEIVSDSREGEPIELVGEPVEEGDPGPAGAATIDGVEAPIGEDGIPILSAADDEEAPAPAGAAVTDDGFEPADHNVDQVRKYLSAHPDQAGFVLDRERAGKSRTSLIGA